MYVPDKEYIPNISELNELEERQKHEEEMERAFERMEKERIRKRKTFLCILTGFLVGVIYILYVAAGLESVDLFLGKLSGGNSIVRFLLDFLPPILLTGIVSYFIARKEKGTIIYIFSAISVFSVVLLVFLVYVSLMMM